MFKFTETKSNTMIGMQGWEGGTVDSSFLKTNMFQVGKIREF